MKFFDNLGWVKRTKQTVKRGKISQEIWEKPLCKGKEIRKEGKKTIDEKNKNSGKKIILRLLAEQIRETPSGGFRIPKEIARMLGVLGAKQIFITLYEDKTITLEKVPEELFAPSKEPEAKIPPSPREPSLKEKGPKRQEVSVRKIPADWILLTKTYLLTPKADIRRPNRHLFMRKEKVIKAARIIKSSATRKEAVKGLTDKLNFSESSVGVVYPLIGKALPHLEKMMPEKLRVSKKAQSEVKIEPPKELVEILRRKEKEKILTPVSEVKS